MPGTPGWSGRRRAERERRDMPHPVAEEDDGHPHARLPGPDGLDERGDIGDPLAGEAHDHVTWPQAGPGRRAARRESERSPPHRDFDPGAKARVAAVDHRADDRMRGLAGADDLGRDQPGLIDRDREAEPDAAALPGQRIIAYRRDGRVHADD